MPAQLHDAPQLVGEPYTERRTRRPVAEVVHLVNEGILTARLVHRPQASEDLDHKHARRPYVRLEVRVVQFDLPFHSCPSGVVAWATVFPNERIRLVWLLQVLGVAKVGDDCFTLEQSKLNTRTIQKEVITYPIGDQHI